MSEESLLPQTEHPTTEQLLDFMATLTFNADYRSYMREVLKRIVAYKDIEKLATVYKKASEETASNARDAYGGYREDK